MASASQIGSSHVAKSRDVWKLGDAIVLLAYSCVVLWTLPYHEKWADEAQAWLIARDLDLRTIWFHELRYEGSPGLWHTILWVAQHVFHAGYGALGYIGASFAIAGAAMLIFLAPFPRYIRWPLAFTYVMIYQYAVIARPYTLLPLLAFTAAFLFNNAAHPERITIVLALLALLTLHGAILAGCFGAAYLAEAWNGWSLYDERVKRKYYLCLAVMGIVFLFVALILRPTPDVEEFATKGQMEELARSLNLQVPGPQTKLISIVSGALLGNATISFLFLLLTGAWCAVRRKVLPFALSVSLLIGLYVAVHGYSHHHGTLTIAIIASVWVAWPAIGEKARLTVFQRRVTQGMAALLVIFCGVQIWDAGVVIRNEYLYPYSGAGDAANFLTADGAFREPIYGYLYGVTGIQAYFDHNIFANLSTSYFHHGLPLEGANLDLGEVGRAAPGHIVIFSEQPQLMQDSGVLNGLGPLGYAMVHFSDGYVLYRRGVYVRQAYFIFRRTGWEEEGIGTLSPRSP